MVMYNFTFQGSGAAPQADDAEISTVLENQTSFLTLPFDVRILDVVTDISAAQTHEFRFYVNGRQQGSQFFSAQINPTTQGRLNWANQNIVIPKGSQIQIRGSQKTGAAEAIKVAVQFSP